jgi:hypothetical protein
LERTTVFPVAEVVGDAVIVIEGVGVRVLPKAVGKVVVAGMVSE